MIGKYLVTPEAMTYELSITRVPPSGQSHTHELSPTVQPHQSASVIGKSSPSLTLTANKLRDCVGAVSSRTFWVDPRCAVRNWYPLDTPRTTTKAAEPTEARQARRRRYAMTLCTNASNATSWRMANRLAARFGCGGCEALGVSAPKDFHL